MESFPWMSPGSGNCRTAGLLSHLSATESACNSIAARSCDPHRQFNFFCSWKPRGGGLAATSRLELRFFCQAHSAVSSTLQAGSCLLPWIVLQGAPLPAPADPFLFGLFHFRPLSFLGEAKDYTLTIPISVWYLGGCVNSLLYVECLQRNTTSCRKCTPP